LKTFEKLENNLTILIPSFSLSRISSTHRVPAVDY